METGVTRASPRTRRSACTPAARREAGLQLRSEAWDRNYERAAERYRRRFTALAVNPIVADFTSDFALPAGILAEGRRVAFFPGSTIGNLNTKDAGQLLQRMRRQVGPQGAAIIGVDLKKDCSVLLPAYDDSAGVTAEFNRNILVRINRELEGQFAPEQFRHVARWNEAESAVEMHLESPIDQVIAVAGKAFAFRRGETIARGAIDTGDQVFVDKFTYNFVKPRRGDVFVFRTNHIPQIPEDPQTGAPFRCASLPRVRSGQGHRWGSRHTVQRQSLWHAGP